jgi:hypothetical protein
MRRLGPCPATAQSCAADRIRAGTFETRDPNPIPKTNQDRIVRAEKINEF